MRDAAAAGLAWSLAQSWGGRVLSTLVFIVLGRLLTPEDFGVVALAAVFVEVGSVLTVSGYHRAIVQRSNLGEEHLDAAFWASTAIGLMLMCLAWVSAPALAYAFDEPDLTAILRVMSVGFVLTGIGSTFAAVIHRRMQFRTFAIRQFVATAVAGTAAVAVAIAGLGAWALVTQAIVAPAVSLVIIVSAARWRPRLRVSGVHLRELTGFGSKVLGADMVGLVNRQADSVLVGVFLGPAALGFYTIAYRTYSILLEVIVYSVSSVAFPVFSRMSHDQERTARAVLTASRLGALVMVPAFVGIAVLAPDLIPLLFGEQWEASIPVLRVLSVAAMITSVTFFVNELILAMGKAGWEFARAAAGTAAVVVAIRVGVEWGIVGVAFARLAHSAVFGPFGVYLAHKLVPFSWPTYLRQLVVPTVSAMAMGILVLAAAAGMGGVDSDLIRVVVLSGLGLVVYAVLVRLLGRTQFEELLSYAQPLVRRLIRR